jgi:hypothetical protein
MTVRLSTDDPWHLAGVAVAALQGLRASGGRPRQARTRDEPANRRHNLLIMVARHLPLACLLPSRSVVGSVGHAMLNG